MALIPSAYRPPWPFKNGHISTIYSALVRKPPPVVFQRERLELPDGDFLDLDWAGPENKPMRILILLHGLEGNARRPYMQGSAALFAAAGYRVCSVNFRGCSGEPNRLYRSYHSGATEDLREVVRYLAGKFPGVPLFLKGFSLGGNLTLKFLGEGNPEAAYIRGAVAVSVPVQLRDSLEQLNKANNALYARRFLVNLKDKLKQKNKRFPERISLAEIGQIKTLKDFDDRYTSVAHGFRDALDYYRQCSALQFLDGITTPSLLLNARNDSFLGPECYPRERCEAHPYLSLEMPEYGGHVGFYTRDNRYYNELRAVEFLEGLS